MRRHPPLTTAGSCGGIRFDAEPIVHGASELLLASEIPLRRLDGDVAEEELDLLEFATGQVAQPAHVRRRSCGASFSMPACAAAGPDDIPQHLRLHPVAPDPAGLVDGPKDAPLGDGGGRRPSIDRGLDPLRDGHGPDMAALSDEIGDDPVLLPLLDRFQRERQQLAAAQPQPMSMASIAYSRSCRGLAGLRAFQEPPALLRCQPVSEPDAETSNTLHAADAGGQLRAQEAGIGRLVRHTTHSGQTQVDGGGAYCCCSR